MAEGEGVPEIVTDPEPVSDTLFVCVVLRVTVEEMVVVLVPVPDGFTVKVPVCVCVASLDPEAEAVVERLAVEERVPVLDAVLEGVLLGVDLPEPETLGVPDPVTVIVCDPVAV